MSSYVYIKSEPQLWTVGFYEPNGCWQPESDWDNPQDAAERVAWLNGGRRETEKAPSEAATSSGAHEISQLQNITQGG